MKLRALLPLALLAVLLAPLAAATPQVPRERVCVAPNSFPVVYLGDCGEAPTVVNLGQGDHDQAVILCEGGLYVPGGPYVSLCYEIVLWYP